MTVPHGPGVGGRRMKPASRSIRSGVNDAPRFRPAAAEETSVLLEEELASTLHATCRQYHPQRDRDLEDPLPWSCHEDGSDRGGVEFEFRGPRSADLFSKEPQDAGESRVSCRAVITAIQKADQLRRCLRQRLAAEIVPLIIEIDNGETQQGVGLSIRVDRVILESSRARLQRSRHAGLRRGRSPTPEIAAGLSRRTVAIIAFQAGVDRAGRAKAGVT